MAIKQTIAITHSSAYVIFTWSDGDDVKRIPKRNLTIIYHNQSENDKVYLNWPAGAYGQKKDHMSLDYTWISSPAVGSNAALALLLQIYVDDQSSGIAVGGGVLVGKSVGATEEDFVVTYTSATQLTFSIFPIGITGITAIDIEVVRQINAVGLVVQTYTRDDTSMDVTADVLTVTGAAFAVGDTFVIYTKIPHIIAERRAVGFWGSDTYGDGNNHNGAWYALRVVAEATIGDITDNPLSGPISTIPLGVPIPANAYISAAGYFSNIQLDVGMVVMYRIMLATTTTTSTTSTTSTTTTGDGGGGGPV